MVDALPITRPVLRWMGGKYKLAPWVVSHFPKHQVYAELFGGAGSVLMRKPPVFNEIYNDLDGELVNLFRVLRGNAAPELIRLLTLTPYSEAEFKDAFEPCSDPVEQARRLVVRSHMGHGTGGARIDRRTGFRMDGLSCRTNVAGEWDSYPEALAAVVQRLRRVTIVQRPAIKLLRRFDHPRALIYLDPPYVPETRSAKVKDGEGYHTYAFDMGLADHREMLEALTASRAMIVLSGYSTDLYDAALTGWTKRTKDALAHRDSKRTECLWINPAAAEALAHGPLFGQADD